MKLNGKAGRFCEKEKEGEAEEEGGGGEEGGEEEKEKKKKKWKKKENNKNNKNKNKNKMMKKTKPLSSLRASGHQCHHMAAPPHNTTVQCCARMHASHGTAWLPPLPSPPCLAPQRTGRALRKKEEKSSRRTHCAGRTDGRSNIGSGPSCGHL